MGYDSDWNNLPVELLIAIGLRLSFAEDYVKFAVISKSWRSAAREVENRFLPPRLPWLLLAEEVAPGAMHTHHAFDDNDIDDNDEEDGDDDDDDDIIDNNNFANIDDLKRKCDHQNNSIGSTRGLYSLSTGKTYTIELPEAAGRVLFGANNGWLITVGIDMQITLLHPLFRHQILLPSMIPEEHDEYFSPETEYDIFVHKVVLSSRIPTENTVTSSHDEYHNTNPIVMAIYGYRHVWFARLGDEVWTKAIHPGYAAEDIAYHKGKFYIVDCQGSVFLYNIDNDNTKGGYTCTKIASLPINILGQLNEIYLVETLSGSGLWLVVRTRRIKYRKPPQRMRSKYRTIDFSLWKLELRYCDGQDIPSCSLTKENNLENEAIFVGRASSVSVPSSEIIKPNCIYFTDDNDEIYGGTGGGHDMGIFNIESRTIQPHFEGRSIHPNCPPLWYM